MLFPETLAFFALPLSPTPDEGNARSPPLLGSCPKHTEENGTPYRGTSLDIHRLHSVIPVILQCYRKPKPSRGEIGKFKPWPKAQSPSPKIASPPALLLDFHTDDLGTTPGCPSPPVFFPRASDLTASNPSFLSFKIRTLQCCCHPLGHFVQMRRRCPLGQAHSVMS